LQQKAFVYTGNLLTTNYAKTAHGLIRGTNRYKVIGIIDSKHAGQDAGMVLDGISREIPVYASIEDAIKQSKIEADVFILGVAYMGGEISDNLRSVFLGALYHGLDLVSGLHSLLCEDQEISKHATKLGRTLTDVRKPKKNADLHFWSGEITNVTIPRIAVLGTDCALGKRTTAKIITDKLNQSNLKSCMIYTGQTGWLQGWDYGFILDSTPNDFVCGELEHAVLTCIKEEKPDIVLLEGQSALRNPSGPCGSEFLLSAGARYVILQTAPARDYFAGLESFNCVQYSLRSEVDLIQAYGADVIAISLNHENLTREEIERLKASYREELKVPVFSPIHDDMTEVIDLIIGLTKDHSK